MPFYFAWCGPGEAFSGAHLREDELILSFDIAHLEGQIPTLDIEVKNPHVGLLAPGRLQWAWFSYFDGVTYTPLFYGRLIALPSNLLGEVVTLKFISRPTNFMAQKQSWAESLKVSPYYDPIWINQSMLDDPDTILESYSASWHVDRFAQGVTVSDITFGEDGTEEFMPEDSFYDSVSISFAQTTQNQVIFDGKIDWTQEEVGVVALPPTSITAANSAQIASDFPKAGQTLADGVTVASSSVDITNGSVGGTPAAPQEYHHQYKNYEAKHSDGDVLTYNFSQTGWLIGTIVNLTGGGTSGDAQHGIAAEHHYSADYMGVMDVGNGSPNVQTNMSVRYEMQRGRTEILKFIMVSELQSIITTPDDAPFNPIKISMQGSDVNLALAGQPPPLGYSGRSTFIPTDRGMQSMLYPMLVGRAHLMQSARAVKVSFDCTFERTFNLSCRKNALLHDSRLPGGQVIGKITEYHIKGSGDSGDLIGTVQLESTIGTGDQIFISEGNPTYVADGYAAVGYQFYENADLSLPTSDMTIEMPASVQVDDGLVTPLTLNQIVTKFIIHQGIQTGNILASSGPFVPTFSTDVPPNNVGLPSVENQYNTAVTNSAVIDQTLRAAIQADPTWIELQVQPVSNQSFHAEYDLGVGILVAPKMINLEAASG
jgi:hypothetical protein